MLPLLVELQRSSVFRSGGVLCFESVQPVQRSHQYFRDEVEADVLRSAGLRACAHAEIARPQRSASFGSATTSIVNGVPDCGQTLS